LIHKGGCSRRSFGPKGEDRGGSSKHSILVLHSQEGGPNKASLRRRKRAASFSKKKNTASFSQGALAPGVLVKKGAELFESGRKQFAKRRLSRRSNDTGAKESPFGSQGRSKRTWVKRSSKKGRKGSSLHPAWAQFPEFSEGKPSNSPMEKG